MVTAARLGIYRKPDEEIEGDIHDPLNIFEIDDFAGCLWCSTLPEDLQALFDLFKKEGRLSSGEGD